MGDGLTDQQARKLIEVNERNTARMRQLLEIMTLQAAFHVAPSAHPLRDEIRDFLMEKAEKILDKS